MANGFFKKIFRTLALLTFPFYLFAVQRSPLAIQAFNDGARHFNAREFREAIPFFDRAIEHDPLFAEAYYGRGTCEHYLKEMAAALSDLNHAIEDEPELLDAYSVRGIVLYEQGQSMPALADFNHVLKLQPNDAQSLLARGVIYLKQEKVSAAKEDFKRFLALRPRDPMAPRLRKLLASLPPEENVTEYERKGVSESNPDTPSPRYTDTVHVPPSAQQLADEILFHSHELENQASRQALRGERVQVTGDLQNKSSESTTSGIEIVEPK